MSSKSKPEEGVGVSFKISFDADDVLSRSAEVAERAKKREAKLRLEDHLKRFPDWKP